MAGPAFAETLNNQNVIALVGAGLGDEAVIAKIKASAGQYDTSTDALIALKRAGASSAVIAAVIEASNGTAVSDKAMLSSDSPDPKVPHQSGIYMLADWLPEAKMLVLDPTTSNQTKTGGMFGYMLTGGIASMSFKTVLPSPTARVGTQKPRPKFYFYFDQAGRSLSTGGATSIWMAGSVTSPNEFSLVRFSVKSGRREAKVGKFNLGGAKAGVMDEDRIQFDYNQVSPGVFAAMPSNDLPPGEYGFIYSISTGGGGMGAGGVGAQTSKIFDFSIAPDPARAVKRK